MKGQFPGTVDIFILFLIRDVTVPSGTGPRPGPDRDRTKMHGTAVWSGHGPSLVRSWSGASQDFQDRVGTGQDRSRTGPMLRRGLGG